MIAQLGSCFWPVYKKFSSSGQNDETLWWSFSKGDSLLDYCFHLFKKTDVVLTLVSPDIGQAGVEGDQRTAAGQATRTMASNRGKRRRLEDESAMASLATHSAALAQAVAKQTSFGELATLSETLKNLRQANADPRFISAVEQRLERILFPPTVPAAPAASAGEDDSYAGLSRATTEGECVSGSKVKDDESETFL